MKLYPTPPSILTLVTWVPQSRLAFGHSARRLAIGPSALAKRNPTVCSLACRWRLRSALRADRESFSIETHVLCLIVGPNYTAPICPTATVWDSTIYPNFQSPSSLAWVQRTQAGLRPNPHIGWPTGLRPSAKVILQCAASLAAGGYDQPCGPIKSLFLLETYPKERQICPPKIR